MRAPCCGEYRHVSLKKCLIVFLAILGETCFADITIEAPKQTDSNTYLANAMVKVLISCYGNQVNGVSLYGDSTGILFRTLLSKQTLPVILIDSTAEVVHGSVQRESQYKLQVFTIVTRSSTQLKKSLEDIKNLPWWNYMAFFLLLSWETESNGCSNAFRFLWVAWEMNVLNVKFLCVHPTTGVLLYTYNPYTKEAPNSWKLKNTFRGKNDHPWSLFVQRYRDDEGICEGLDFDKTRDLGGYVIPSSAQETPVFWHTNFNKTGIHSFEGLDGTLVQMSFPLMNANARLVRGSYDVDANFLVTIKNGETTGIVLDVMNGISDIVLSPYYQDKLTNLTITYPHWNSGLAAVTQKSGHVKSQLGKINSVIDVDSRHGLCLVMLITPICFKYFLRQALTPAILNTARIICNSSLLKLPMKISTRIYLATLFFFQITILALYQGQLASLLTKPMYLKNVDSIHDLADLGHTIYVHKDTASSFTDPIFEGRIVKIETYDCLKYVLRDESAACVRDWDILISTVTNPKLHVSREMIVQSSLVYVIREDWPLQQRFNEILARMSETGLTRHTYTKYSDKLLSINKFYEKTERLNSYKAITSSDLGFAFAILGIGLGCATVTFIVEILIS